MRDCSKVTWQVTAKAGQGKHSDFPADKMAQWLEEPAPEPDDLNLISGTHVVGGENELLQIVLCPPCMHCDAHTLKHNKNILKRKGTQTSFFSLYLSPTLSGLNPTLGPNATR